VHIDDVVRAFALAAAHREAWSVYNIGSGQGLSVLDIMRTIESILVRPSPVSSSSHRRPPINSSRGVFLILAGPNVS